MKQQNRKCFKVLLAVLIGFGLSMSAMAADAVEPASITNMVNTRAESEVTLSGVYFRDGSLMFSNSLCLVGTTGSNTQGLDGVEVELTVGNSATSLVYTATVYAVSDVTNRWWQTITVPDTTGTINVQTKLTDGNTNIFIYPWKRLSTKAPL